jgi:CubicO group peptidase (beta-lactamase class C family)
MNDTSFYVTDKSKQDRIAEPFAKDRKIGNDADFFDSRIEQKWESAGGGLVYCGRLCAIRNDAAQRRHTRWQALSERENHRIHDFKPHSSGVRDRSRSLLSARPGFGFGLGFAVRTEAGVSPQNGSAGEYNWSGTGGTTFWVDPKEDLFVVFMMQSPSQRTRYRTMLHNVVYGAFEGAGE